MEIITTIREADEPIAIMQIKGDINAANFLEIVNKAQAIFNNPARYLIIDLAEVPSISTTGLVALHKISLIYSGDTHEMDTDTQNMRPDFTHNVSARKYVKLINPQPDVDKALEKAGMKLFFKTYTDLEDALQAIKDYKEAKHV